MDSIVTRSLRDQIHDVVLGRILSGRYRPGERLLPDQLRAEFSISITPIREALQKLASAGFVEIRAREGAYVSVLDARRAGEIFDVRTCLEVLAARNSATRIPPSELAELARRYHQADVELASGAGDEALGSFEPALHDLMLKYSDNDVLKDTLTMIHRQWAWVRAIAGRAPGYLQSAFEEHKVILDALKRRDPDAAAEATRAHLQSVKAHVVEYLRAAELTAARASEA